MRYYIIAGEASGDLHASNLIAALRGKDAAADFRVWGGDLMQQAGGELVKHYRDLAFMGFWEVAKNIRTILGNFKFCKQDIKTYQPDVLILVDYPGFNLRMAKWAKEEDIRVFYYISPQIWAWNSKRVHQIKRDVERMFVILPFEKDFYKKYEVEVDFVGHPLLDVIDTNGEEQQNSNIIALLPGSRRQEIKRMLSIMLEVVPFFPDYEFVIAGAPGIPEDFYQPYLQNKKVTLVQNQTYQLLQTAQAALVTSGTATLETALFKVPQVVCYRGNSFSYFLARRLVKVKYISLVNLIMDKEVVKELIQDELTVDNLKAELHNLLGLQDLIGFTKPSNSDLTDRREEQNLTGLRDLSGLRDDYQQLQQKLGGKGAAERTSHLMLIYLRTCLM